MSVKAQNTLYQFLTVKSCFDVAFDFPNLTSVIALLQIEDRMMISGIDAIMSSPWLVCLRRNPLGLRGVFTELREIQRSAHGSWNVQLLWQSWPPQPDVLNSINDSLYSSLFSASLLPSSHEFHAAVITVDTPPLPGARLCAWLVQKEFYDLHCIILTTEWPCLIGTSFWE